MIYIDEIESFLYEHIHEGDGCLLHHVLFRPAVWAACPRMAERIHDDGCGWGFANLQDLIVSAQRLKPNKSTVAKSSDFLVQQRDCIDEGELPAIDGDSALTFVEAAQIFEALNLRTQLITRASASPLI